MENMADISGGVPPFSQQRGHLLQIGDRLQIIRALLLSKPAIQIGTHPHMQGVTGYLADMIQVIDHFLQVALPSLHGVDLRPRTHPGTIIQASSAPPMTAPLSIRAFIISSLN